MKNSLNKSQTERFSRQLIFLYTYLIGDSKLGPYRTFTLFFFKERNISSETT